MDNLEELEEEIFKSYNRDNKENLDTWNEIYKLLDVFNSHFDYYVRYFKENIDPNSKFDDVLSKSLVRIFKTFNEILVLLRNGFPEGALARWRTLYENIIIIILIIESEDKEEMSKKYIDNQEKINIKNLKKYVEISEMEGSLWEKVNIDKSILESIESKVKDYSWTGLYTFADIQEKYSPSDYKIHYSTANWCIHSGNYKSLCLLEDSIGSSNINGIRTKYLIDEVIGATLQILLFFFKRLDDELFNSNKKLNEYFIVFGKLNNIIVKEIINIRKDIYNYAE